MWKTIFTEHFPAKQTERYSLNQIINHRNNLNLKHKSFKILCFDSDFHYLKDSNERRKDH